MELLSKLSEKLKTQEFLLGHIFVQRNEYYKQEMEPCQCPSRTRDEGNIHCYYVVYVSRPALGETRLANTIMLLLNGGVTPGCNGHIPSPPGWYFHRHNHSVQRFSFSIWNLYVPMKIKADIFCSP